VFLCFLDILNIRFYRDSLDQADAFIIQIAAQVIYNPVLSAIERKTKGVSSVSQ